MLATVSLDQDLVPTGEFQRRTTPIESPPSPHHFPVITRHYAHCDCGGGCGGAGGPCAGLPLSLISGAQQGTPTTDHDSLSCNPPCSPVVVQIVIVEEAAEVQEAHVLACLSL